MIGIINAPHVWPSTVTDCWREHTINKEPALTGFGVKSTGVPSASSRQRRTSCRSQRSTKNKSGPMLLDMKHTLAFLEKYNRGTSEEVMGESGVSSAVNKTLKFTRALCAAEDLDGQ